MKKLLWLLVLLPSLALGTTTWTTATSQPVNSIRAVTAVFTTGTEAAPPTPVKAYGTLALTSVVAGNTATVNGVVLMAHAVYNTGTNFLVGADDTATAVNLVAAVNRNSSYTKCTATSLVADVTLTAKDYGTDGNAIALTGTTSKITPSGATLSGGVNVAGLRLEGLKSITLFAHSATAMSVGYYRVYVFNAMSGVWVRVSDAHLDLATSAVTDDSWSYSVTMDWSYIAWVPDGVGVATTLHVLGRLN